MDFEDDTIIDDYMSAASKHTVVQLRRVSQLHHIPVIDFEHGTLFSRRRQALVVDESTAGAFGVLDEDLWGREMNQSQT